MEPEAKTAFDALVGVITWELEAQAGVQRRPDQIPVLLADSLMDYFDIRPRDLDRMPVGEGTLAEYELRRRPGP